VKVIYVSPVPLHSVAQRPQHFAYWLHQRFHARVLWVETSPIRYPRWSDLSPASLGRHAFKRSAADQAQSWVDEPWITSLRLSGLPFEPSRLGRMINRTAWRSFESKVRHWLHQDHAEGDENSKSWLVVGRPCDAALWLHQCFPDLPIFYDIMDDMAAFYEGASRRWVSECDDAILKAAQAVMVSSNHLLERYRKRKSASFLVPNGLAMGPRYKAFNWGVKRRQGASITKSKQLVLGYIGAIAPWFDWSLVYGLRQQLVDEGFKRFKIVLIGPVHVDLPADLPIDIEIKPAIAQELIWDVLATFDIGLIPFKINELTAAVDPVKYYEYRAAALPILSSRFGDMALRTSDDGVYFFESMQADQHMIETMLKQALIPDPSFIETNRWESRFANIDCFP
jgi:hypothetical protein